MRRKNESRSTTWFHCAVERQQRILANRPKINNLETSDTFRWPFSRTFLVTIRWNRELYVVRGFFVIVGVVLVRTLTLLKWVVVDGLIRHCLLTKIFRWLFNCSTVSFTFRLLVFSYALSSSMLIVFLEIFDMKKLRFCEQLKYFSSLCVRTLFWFQLTRAQWRRSRKVQWSCWIQRIFDEIRIFLRR